jgi:hypothetical protein
MSRPPPGEQGQRKRLRPHAGVGNGFASRCSPNLSIDAPAELS